MPGGVAPVCEQAGDTRRALVVEWGGRKGEDVIQSLLEAGVILHACPAHGCYQHLCAFLTPARERIENGPDGMPPRLPCYGEGGKRRNPNAFDRPIAPCGRNEGCIERLCHIV